MRRSLKYNVLLLFIISILTGIFACDLESEHNLGNDYYLIGDNANTAIVKKVQGKEGVSDGVILGEIKDYDFDRDFILIFRNASAKAKVYSEDDPLWEKQQGKDSLQYWIIEKHSGVVHGPLDKLAYREKRKELRIPEKLQVKGASQY